MVRGNGWNQFRQYTWQNGGNQIVYNAVQNAGNQIVYNVVQNTGNQDANQMGNGNFVTTRAEGNARIQLQAEEFDLMAAAEYEEIEEVKVNCILMANLQQASTSGTHTDKAPVYDSDGSIEDDSNVILLDSSMNPSGGDVEQHPGTIEETHPFFESLYNNLAIEVENVNTVNRETKEANVKLIAELARYRGR
ncbi:hypothetical protein Tco_0066100 [Tanacetum coccineum]